jgi:hypothetical protein
MGKKMKEMGGDVKREREILGMESGAGWSQFEGFTTEFTEMRGRRSAAEMGEEPEQESQADAEEDGSGDWEIERGVLAAVDDVAGKATEAEGEAVGEVEEGAGGDEDCAEDEESAGEGAGGVHGRSLAGSRRGDSAGAG